MAINELRSITTFVRTVELGSLSKAITATAVMRLVQDGRLNLSAPVTSRGDA